MNSSNRRLSQNGSTTASGSKQRLDPLNRILKTIGSSKIKRQKKEAIVKQLSRVALSDLLKNTPTNNNQDIPDFKTFLINKDNVQIFREFLKTQYCQENIDFYSTCEKYRQLDPDKVGFVFMKLMATQIFNDFLNTNARQPVNINYECLQNIIRLMKDDKLQPNLFNDAQAEIFDLMRNDCYPRFCKTWRLDRNAAQKILCQREKTDCTPLSSRCAESTTTSLGCHSTIDCPNSSMLSSQSKGIKRKTFADFFSGCPTNCPYYRVGLPCQQHNVDEVGRVEETGKSDLIDKIDLSRIHKVPNCCARRTPPPPPLPPKPDNLQRLPPIKVNRPKKRRAYFGEPVDV